MAQLTRVISHEFTEAQNHHERNIGGNQMVVKLQTVEANNRRNGCINPTFNGSAVSILGLPTLGNNMMNMEKENPKDFLVEMSEIKRDLFHQVPVRKPRTNEMDEAAIVVVNACKSFKSGGKSVPVLDNLCMTVKKGTIYSLLGSSGCGKTTFLTCAVGMKHLDSGKIYVLGAKTGTKVPGKKIGYMPQDTALYGDFSIKETITYFGSLYGMSNAEIESRKVFLISLLSLPEESRRVSTLSGGQKRRVSLAVSLVHSPQLLILDEPTVGVDPLLRTCIWNHLLKLVSDGETTVIITTHYIDEAKNSKMVGVMRGGKLLAERQPLELFEEFKTNSLEEVVLKLCHDDEDSSIEYGRPRSKSSGNILSKVEVEKRYTDPVSLKNSLSSRVFYPEDEESFIEGLKNSFVRIKSLTMKNSFVMMRNILLVLFVILMPAMQTVVMGMSMGNDPKPIKVGVVNHEFNSSTDDSCNLDAFNRKNECDVQYLSCRYLRAFPEDIQLTNYKTEDEAREEIKSGKITSFMIFPNNYSEYMYERSTSGIIVENETLQGSLILFEMDASNAVITKSLQRIIYESYKTFIQELLFDCGFNPELGGVPIKFRNPIYGDYNLQFRDYVAAGMLVGVALFFPLCSSSITYIWDKKQKTMERARVAGCETFEIMASYLVSEGTILLGQTCLSFLILTVVFKIPIVGSTSLAFFLVVLNGLAGLSLGLLLASICQEEIQAILLGLAIIFPNFFLAGSIWPISGMPLVLQYFSYALPGTLSCEAFRSIVVKGWGFTHFYVWTGFASTICWMILYWILSIIVHRFQYSKK